MAWIPTFTIRVGAVILLLFVTRVLVETYRYTLSICAYYYARADALQLITVKKSDPFPTEQFKELFQSISPNDIKVDKIESVEDKVTQVLAQVAKIRSGAP